MGGAGAGSAHGVGWRSGSRDDADRADLPYHSAMTRSSWITAAVLAAIAIAITIALFLEAAAGPVFRAEDYASYQECMRNIPMEWGPGSMQRSGAEESCLYVHGRSR
jgi:hypothetical protein